MIARSAIPSLLITNYSLLIQRNGAVFLSTPEQVLKEYFGYDSFRAGQRTLVDAALAGHDALGVMPTGAGKSICYQVPALLLNGLTIVISPLISLMQDQVGALTEAGVPAACIHSGLDSAAFSRAMRSLYSGRCRLLYVAPERLTGGLIDDLTRAAPVAMVTVDEAHCISQWGQDFRPSYLGIADFIERLPVRPVVTAFTATATPEVRADIIRLLGLRDPELVVTGFDRPNLYFEVRKPLIKSVELLRILRERQRKSGIVYCTTRKNVERVCEMLQKNGFAATRYHAGLSDEERRANQEEFLYDRATVMVATNAFGMGIDKSNVSFVVHYNMPKNLESYYQEAGRAGRDGSPADCILLYSGQDVVTNEFLIANSSPDERLTEAERIAVRERDLERLRDMTFYCACETCLRAFILKYFGETAPNYCANCGNCKSNFDTVDVTIEAQKIVSCVFRLAQRRRKFGKQMISDILRGVKSERIERLGLTDLSTFGIMADEQPTRLRTILDYLILHGYLAQTAGDMPCVVLTEKSIIRERKPVSMKLPRKLKADKIKAADVDQSPDSLYEALRKTRETLAKRAGIPPYLIFSNKTLQEMVVKQPRTLVDFRAVSGVGEAKAERYYKPFIKTIEDYLDQHE